MSVGLLSKAGTTSACVTVRWLQPTIFRLCLSYKYVMQDPCLTQRVLSRGKYCKAAIILWVGTELELSISVVSLEIRAKNSEANPKYQSSNLQGGKKTHKMLIKISFKELCAT